MDVCVCVTKGKTDFFGRSCTGTKHMYLFVMDSISVVPMYPQHVLPSTTPNLWPLPPCTIQTTCWWKSQRAFYMLTCWIVHIVPPVSTSFHRWHCILIYKQVWVVVVHTESTKLYQTRQRFHTKMTVVSKLIRPRHYITLSTTRTDRG
jgi:hypothetical protein